MLENYRLFAAGKMKGYPVGQMVVFRIIEDLSDRKGLHDEWDMIDDAIKDEILETWHKIVVESLEE